VADFSVDYTVYYRWQWFARELWRKDFRATKRASATAFASLVNERGLAAAPVLDCSSGLGQKTIVIREAGANVEGSDKCAFAVEHAAKFAAEEGYPDLRFFESAWAGLPRAAGKRYAAIFNDALSWISSDDEMAASLKGLHDVLLPGGVLAYMGALPGSAPESKTLLDEEWRGILRDSKRIVVGFHHVQGGAEVTEIQVAEKGPDYIDRHHIYVVEAETGAPRLESTTMRCVYKWDWDVIEPFLRRAGFRAFSTKDFTGDGGRPFQLVVAERD